MFEARDSVYMKSQKTWAIQFPYGVCYINSKHGTTKILPPPVQKGLENYKDLFSKATKTFILESAHWPHHVTEFNNTITLCKIWFLVGRENMMEEQCITYMYSFMLKMNSCWAPQHIKV
jgi:hypothetical protein